jgi:hypothetical protein
MAAETQGFEKFVSDVRHYVGDEVGNEVVRAFETMQTDFMQGMKDLNCLVARYHRALGYAGEPPRDVA